MFCKCFRVFHVANAPLLYCNSPLAMSTSSHNFYKLTALRLGAEVNGINLKKEPLPEVLHQIKQDVTTHRLLIFKDQGVLSGERQVQISRWFGEPESTFYQHPRSPHYDVFRVSNDSAEGCTNVGRTGWHIDGSFQERPFSHSIYHMVSVPKSGATVFAGLTDVIEDLTPEQRKRWDRLYMASDRRSGPVHPLVYRHPVTRKHVLCFHLGMTDAFVWDKGTDQERRASHEETDAILQEIHHEFVKDHKKHQYRHEWAAGELILSDNLAVGHEASPETQLPVSQVGLRVMHRVTIGGTSAPSK